MNPILEIFRKHSVALIFLLFYNLLCLQTLRDNKLVEDRLASNPGISGITAGGEWGGVLLLMAATIFSLFSCCWAIGSKTETKFYLGLILIIIAEAIAVLQFISI